MEVFAARIDADGRMHLDAPEAWRHLLRRHASTRVELMIRRPSLTDAEPEVLGADRTGTLYTNLEPKDADQ